MLATVRSEPPFSIRACGDRVLIVGSSAAPVGGDRLSFDVVVGEFAHLNLATSAATMVLPGPTGERSTMSTTCRIRDGAHLDWRPEPTVSVRGSDHVVVTDVDLHRSATCRLIDEVSLGRSGEPSGALELRLRVERDGRTLLHHTERFGHDIAGAGSVVGVGAAHHVCSSVIVGVDAGRSRTHVDGSVAGAWLPIADDAVAVLAVGPDRPAVLDLLRTLAPELTSDMTVRPR